MYPNFTPSVIPAQAGIQCANVNDCHFQHCDHSTDASAYLSSVTRDQPDSGISWIPVFAGMTAVRGHVCNILKLSFNAKPTSPHLEQAFTLHQHNPVTASRLVPFMPKTGPKPSAQVTARHSRAGCPVPFCHRDPLWDHLPTRAHARAARIHPPTALWKGLLHT